MLVEQSDEIEADAKGRFGMANAKFTDGLSPGLNFPCRHVPLPRSISPQASGLLAQAYASSLPTAMPQEGDAAAWRQWHMQIDALMEAAASANFAGGPDVEIQTIGNVRTAVARSPACRSDDPRVYLEIHGGALVAGGGLFSDSMAAVAARLHNVRAISVDYRMPPEHPFPAGLEDCLAVYSSLLNERDPSQIVVGGGSAGGNLASALLLLARSRGLPMPAALVLVTPEVDLTESGDSFQTLAGLDATLPSSLIEANRLYAGSYSLDDPLLSPLFGDLHGFPPTILLSGTRDLFLSNTVRMHRSLREAGVDAELHVFEAMPHGGFGGAPEDRARDAEIARFVHCHWERTC